MWKRYLKKGTTAAKDASAAQRAVSQPIKQLGQDERNDPLPSDSSAHHLKKQRSLGPAPSREQHLSYQAEHQCIPSKNRSDHTPRTRKKIIQQIQGEHYSILAGGCRPKKIGDPEPVLWCSSLRRCLRRKILRIIPR